MRLDSVYRGVPKNRRVTVDGRPLSSRKRIINHSPSGFNWGYHGSGPAQLALAILVHFLGDARKAILAHQEFKAEVVAKLEQDKPWELTGRQVAEAPCVKRVIASSVVEE